MFIYTCTGMFPYVCAAMIPVFCEPKTMSKMLRTAVESVWNDKSEPKSVDYKPPTRTKQNVIVAGVCVYTALQLFLPYSHILTQVYLYSLCDQRIYRIIPPIRLWLFFALTKIPPLSFLLWILLLTFIMDCEPLKFDRQLYFY